MYLINNLFGFYTNFVISFKNKSFKVKYQVIEKNNKNFVLFTFQLENNNSLNVSQFSSGSVEIWVQGKTITDHQCVDS